MITNINYVAQAIDPVDHLPFRNTPPYMFTKKTTNYTLVMFRSGKCRLMGCQTAIMKSNVLVIESIRIRIERIQSASATFNVAKTLDLSALGNYCHKQSLGYIFEPELFPALRLTIFDPLCVNLFATGKCVIVGIRHLCYQKYVSKICKLINRSGCFYVSHVNNHAEKRPIIRKDDSTSFQCDSTKTKRLSTVERTSATYPTSTTTKTARQRSSSSLPS